MVKAPGMMAKAPRIIGSNHPRIMLKAPNKMPFYHFKPAMDFHKRRSEMIHWYRHAMRQIENFDFYPQNKIWICCLARSLQARSLRQQ
jgi:hypothetical protein